MKELLFTVLSARRVSSKTYAFQVQCEHYKGVARGKSVRGCFPRGRRLRAGCVAEPHVVPQVKVKTFFSTLAYIS